MYSRVKNKIRKYKDKIKLKKKKVLLGDGCLIDGSNFEGSNYLGENSAFLNSYLGFGSYIGEQSRFYRTKVGRFCSIAKGVEIVPSNHPINYISTHPAFHRGNHPLMQSLGLSYCEKELDEFKHVEGSEFACIIGNDVWLGNNTIILDGVTIGDGAIVGAGSVVTKDVPPYGIVVGVPAKLLRYRFEKKHIITLQSEPWWDLDISQIEKRSKYFDNVENLNYVVNDIS